MGYADGVEKGHATVESNGPCSLSQTERVRYGVFCGGTGSRILAETTAAQASGLALGPFSKLFPPPFSCI
jgi:hypothetical protein